jgi:flagellar basal-body rod protein FlgB
MGEIDGNVTGLLGRMLDVASRKQALVASNIANVDTPGYSTKDIDFKAAMKAAKTEQDRQMLIGDPEFPDQGLQAGFAPASTGMFDYEPEDLPRRNDLNNVSLDREMLGLAQSAGRYSTGIELLKKRFAMIRYALQDGRSG